MATNYMGMSAKTLQPIVTQTQAGIENLQDVFNKWVQGISTLTVSSESLTNQTNALHGNWTDPGGVAFATSSANDVNDMKATAQAMVDAKVGELYVALKDAAKTAVEAINTVMSAAAPSAGGVGGGPGAQAAAGGAALIAPADMIPPPAPIPAAMQALIAEMPKMGQAMTQAMANAQGKWPPAGGQNSPGGNPSASPGATPGGTPGGDQQGQQAGGDQQGQQGQQGAGQEGAGQEGAGGDQAGGGGLPTDDPSLQGGTATPTLPPPTTTPLTPTTPITSPNTAPLAPFAPIGGIGGGKGGGGVGGGGGIGGPKNIPVAASVIKATATPSVGAAPALSGTGTGGAAGTTGAAGGYGGVPPMMPFAPHGGANGVPKSGNGPRSVTGRGPKPSSRVPGLPPSLQGKSGAVDRNAFPAPSKPTLRERNEDTGKLQLLDEEMWQVDQTPAAGNDAAPVRRLLH